MGRGAVAAERAVRRLEPVAPVTVTTPSGLRVHGLQTGWIAIKRAHYRLSVPARLRLPAILLDPRWTEPLPILAWGIEHPEGLIVIDSGERAGVRDLGSYFACADPFTRTVISRNFRAEVAPESELGPQLERLGLSGREVRWLVQTHLHFDHADGFSFVPDAEILVARAEIEGQRARPQGAVACLYPAGTRLRPVDHAAGPYRGFAGHHALTRAGDVVLVPTPGHSYGHQSVLLHDGERTWCFAGDVVMDERQLLERELAGIVHDVPQARASLERVRAFVAATPTVVLPSHDPASMARLAAGRTTEVRPG